MHCSFCPSLSLSLSPLDDDFMRRGREGHKNNELGEKRPKKGETGEEEKDRTDNRIHRKRGGGRTLKMGAPTRRGVDASNL